MNIETCAYFYPLTTQDPERAVRADQVGAILPNETELIQTAQPLFEGHDQPRTHCLGEKNLTVWDDLDAGAVARQTELAKTHGVSCFIFDSFMGYINESPSKELMGTVDAFNQCQESKGMKFAIMATMGKPRLILPIPRGRVAEEPDRFYKLDKKTAKLIVDECATKYWSKSNYFQINSRPYLSILLPIGSQEIIKQEEAQTLVDFISQIREHANLQYKVDPYLVGVIVGHSTLNVSLDNFCASGVDALTGYAFLPEFGQNTLLVQNYDELVKRRMTEWPEIMKRAQRPYIPPAVCGWDASPRGERKNYTLENVAGYYPWHPIVVGNTPDKFSNMLREARRFVQENVPEEEKYSIICSQTEITEGNSLTPRLIDGEVDLSYLKAVQEVVQGTELNRTTHNIKVE